MRTEHLIIRHGRITEGLLRLIEHGQITLRRGKSCGLMNRAIPMSGPNAIIRVPPSRPIQHGRIPGKTQRRTERPQHAFGVAADICGIDYNRGMTLIRQLLKEFGLLHKADIRQARLFEFGRKTGRNPRRMADQENIRDIFYPVPRNLWDYVLRHVLLVKMRFAARNRAQQ